MRNNGRILASAPTAPRADRPTTCPRCGLRDCEWKSGRVYCFSCEDAEWSPKGKRRWRILHLRPGMTPCHAWNAKVDDQDRPIENDGTLYRPGRRLCGYSDCVAVDHIVCDEAVVADVA